MESTRRFAIATGIALLTVTAFGLQERVSPIQQKRNAANNNARAFATVVQARAIEIGHYDNNMASYAKDFGGKIPINPCTGTRTGYTMTVQGNMASVAAMKGDRCGDWKPIVYRLNLVAPDKRAASLSSVDKKRNGANMNARALATAVQAKAITDNKYDPKLADYAIDLGGEIPLNPCTGTHTGYTIVVHGQTAEVSAQQGRLCGKWTPMTFNLTL